LKCKKAYGEDFCRIKVGLKVAKELHFTNAKPLCPEVMEYEAEVKKEIGHDWVGVHQFNRKLTLEIAEQDILND